MGRVDDALRRSGGRKSEDPATTKDFVSPWSVSDEAESRGETEPGKTTPEPGKTTPETFFGEAREATTEHTVGREDLLATSESAHPGLSTQHRRLAATLHNAQIHETLKVVLVTSALPGEGKTLTALNLALTLSRSYLRRVLLIDADLRRPAIHKQWGLPTSRGLSDSLGASIDGIIPTYRVNKTLTVVPAGRVDTDPTSGLTSDRMSRIVQEARHRFDWVVIDTPPVSSVDDATLLTQLCDAVIFVVRARKTPYQVVSRCVESIGQDRIFGVVLNCVEIADSPEYEYYGYYGRYGSYGPPAGARAASASPEPSDVPDVEKDTLQETSSAQN